MGVCDSGIKTENNPKIGNTRINQVFTDNPIIKVQNKELTNVLPSICKLEYLNEKDENGKASGFFIKLNKGNKDFFYLITNEHVIKETMIEKKKEIEIYYYHENNKFNINLNNKERFIKCYKQYDTTVIEILPKDKIHEDYFLLPYTDNINNLQNKKILIPQFPRGEFSFSEGKIELMEKESYLLAHSASTLGGSSGSPIFLENSKEVIAIHKGGEREGPYNIGFLLYPVIQDLKKINNITENDNKYVWENGDYYIGQISKGLPNGKGKRYYKDGRIYEGNFVNGKREGNGKITNKNGDYYIGQYSNDIANGKGKYFINNKMVYDGNYVNGKRQGYGKYFYENGEYYEGQWLNDNKNGKGKRFYKNGKIMYDGDFLDNYAEGKGKYYYENGNLMYEGDYVKDKREGIGKYIWEDGTYYIGKWCKNCRHGKGKMHSKDGEVLQEGYFYEDKFEG